MYVVVSMTKKRVNKRTGMPTVHTYGPYSNETSARSDITRYFKDNPLMKTEVHFSVCRVIDNADD